MTQPDKIDTAVPKAPTVQQLAKATAAFLDRVDLNAREIPVHQLCKAWLLALAGETPPPPAAPVPPAPAGRKKGAPRRVRKPK